MAVASLAASSSSARVHVHLLTCDRDADGERLLRDTIAEFAALRLHLHQVDGARLADAFVDKHLTKEAYLRFLAPEVLPEDVERVIYLDCDLVVLSDIADLYGVDLRGMAMGAVEDAPWADGATAVRMERLGARPGSPYVNSGVMLLDLRSWRRENVTQRLFDCAARHGSSLLRHDQDVLNLVLQDRIALLDKRWNVQTLTFSPAARQLLAPEDGAAREARKRPAVVHYSTERKPWTFRSRARRKDLYYRFLDMTAWRGARAGLATSAHRFEYDLARALLKLGVDVYAPVALAERFGRRIGGAVRRTSRPRASTPSPAASP